MRIVGYLVVGIGHIVAESVGVVTENGEEYFEISNPAVISPGPSPGGGMTYFLTNMVWEYYSARDKLEKSMKIPRKNVLFSSKVDNRMEEVYSNWRAELVRKRSGLILPKSGKADPRLIR